MLSRMVRDVSSVCRSASRVCFCSVMSCSSRTRAVTVPSLLRTGEMRSSYSRPSRATSASRSAASSASAPICGAHAGTTSSMGAPMTAARSRPKRRRAAGLRSTRRWVWSSTTIASLMFSMIVWRAAGMTSSKPWRKIASAAATQLIGLASVTSPSGVTCDSSTTLTARGVAAKINSRIIWPRYFSGERTSAATITPMPARTSTWPYRYWSWKSAVSVTDHIAAPSHSRSWMSANNRWWR